VQIKERESIFMALMTGEQYIESIRRMERDVYFRGEKVEDIVNHPVLRPSMNCIIETYEMALMPEFEDLLTAQSHLTGEKVNRFSHIDMDKEDLMKKVKLQRLLGQRTGTCYHRCVTMDIGNAMYSTTYEIDQKYGTSYHKTFVEYFKEVQQKDLFIGAGVTDPKGDRSKGPLEQADPDLFVHVVERRDDGVVINGAKLHFTSPVNNHEIFILPTMSMKPGCEDYAISCAIPLDAPGITTIIDHATCDLRKLYDDEMDLGNAKFAGLESVIVFDHVFVPNDRIFLNGEIEFTGPLVDRFATYHRNSYGGCKPGVGDTLIGACSLFAEYNGTSKAAHIKDKLLEMTYMNETLWAGGVASSAEGYQMPAGNWMIDPMLANVGKLSVTRFPYEMAKIAEDIVGGLLVTAPAKQDFDNPATGDYLRKFLTGANGVTAEDKVRLIRFIEFMTRGAGAASYLTESLHGGGSPAAMKINIARHANYEAKQKLAKKLANLE